MNQEGKMRGSVLGGQQDERMRQETAWECHSDGGRERMRREGLQRKVGMKVCEKTAVPGIENERGSEKRKW